MEYMKKIEGFENYIVSTKGEICNNKTKRILKKDKCNGGYLRVTLSSKGKTKRFMIHRIVAEAFIDNPENKPCVHHIDHNPENNSVENLEWVTYFENELYNKKDGTRKVKGFVLSEEDVFKIRENYKNKKNTVKQLSEMFGISERNIRRVYKKETYKNYN